MGWNDHVDTVERRCLDCDHVGEWWVWDDTGKARYTGPLGEMLGVDPSKGGKCPNCGSTNGVDFDEDSDEYWDVMYEADLKKD